MFALKVQINGEAPVTAGSDDLGVLNAVVNCVGRLGSKSVSGRAGEPADLFITVGGLTSRGSEQPDEHVKWISQKPLKVGDIISVEVLDTSDADAPISGQETEKRKHDELEYFEHCKKVYLSLREKYESQ
jgi:hypothetical protein